MGSLALDIGALSASKSFDNTKGQTILLDFYDSIALVDEDGVPVSVTNQQKLDHIVDWILREVRVRAIRHHAQDAATAAQITYQDGAETWD